jgi:hypothetical protein
LGWILDCSKGSKGSKGLKCSIGLVGSVGLKRPTTNHKQQTTNPRSGNPKQ